MDEEIGTIQRGGISLSYFALLPPVPHLVLILVHGLSEHKGRYRLLQKDLAQAGYASYAYDQRGFGQSEGRRTHVERYTDFLLDLQAVVRFVRGQHPESKVIVIGHSFGGMVAAAFCIDYPTDADGLVLSAPAYDAPSPPLRVRLLYLLWKPIDPLRLIRYPNHPERLSRDPGVCFAFENDPLVQSAGTPRFYMEFRKMNDHLHQHAAQITIPTLILQGSEDRVIIPQGAKALFEQIKSPKKRLIWYEGFYHEVFNEIGRERVISDLLLWLKEW